MHGKIVTPEQEPELHGIIDRLCAAGRHARSRRWPSPRATCPTPSPPAGTTSNAVVCATRGILRRLDEPELEAVLAHELSHVAHRDVAVMTIASFLGMIAGLLTRVIVLLGGMFGGFGAATATGRGQLAIFEIGVLRRLGARLRHQLPPHLALSRYRELAADRSGAILIGRPVVARLGAGQGDR